MLASTTGRKFSSTQRIDDGSLTISPVRRRKSPKNIQHHQQQPTRFDSPGSPVQLSPLEQRKRGRSSTSNKRPSTTGGGLTRTQRSAPSLHVRPSTRARAQWRMEIDDPLHVSKRLPTGKIQFHTHLSTTEAVTLFDSKETKRLTNLLLQTGGHAAAGHGGLSHHQQAHKVLQRARQLIRKHDPPHSPTTATPATPQDTLHFSLKTELKAVEFSESGIKQVASIHHAVLRLMAQSTCCPSHAALLTDAGSFFRTRFIDGIVALRKEREILRKHAHIEIQKATTQVEHMRARAQVHRNIVIHVLERNANRQTKQLQCRVFVSWKKEVVVQTRTRARKQRARELICNALVRMGAKKNVLDLFSVWRATTHRNIQERATAKLVAQFENDYDTKVAEMQKKIKRIETEKELVAQERDELHGLVEVLTRSAREISEKLEIHMNKATSHVVAKDATNVNVEVAESHDDDDDSKAEASEMSPHPAMVVHLKHCHAMKRLLDSGNFTIQSSQAIAVEPMATQTTLSLLNQVEQTVQTKVNAHQFELMEKAATTYTANVAAEASKTIVTTQDQSMDTMETKAVLAATTDAFAQTRLTMATISTTFNQLSTLQTKYETLERKQATVQVGENQVVLASVQDSSKETAEQQVLLASIAPLIVPVIVPDEETIKKIQQLTLFLQKVHLDAASDFTAGDIKEMVKLFDIHPVQPGDAIIHEGEEATWFGMLLEGELDVIVAGVGTVATMTSGKCIFFF